MQNSLNSKTTYQTTTAIKATPHNISKWSLGRKEIISKNKFLENLLEKKESIIRELKKEIIELNIKSKLNNLEFPSELLDYTSFQFDYTLINEDLETLTYGISNEELNYDNSVVIYKSKIVEHFDGLEINQRDLDSFITEYITDYISL